MAGAHDIGNGSLLRDIVMLLQLFPQPTQYAAAPAACVYTSTTHTIMLQKLLGKVVNGEDGESG